MQGQDPSFIHFSLETWNTNPYKAMFYLRSFVAVSLAIYFSSATAHFTELLLEELYTFLFFYNALSALALL